MKQYHTYMWALVPEGHADGNGANCCVVFHGKTTGRLVEKPVKVLQSNESFLVAERISKDPTCAEKQRHTDMFVLLSL